MYIRCVRISGRELSKSSTFRNLEVQLEEISKNMYNFKEPELGCRKESIPAWLEPIGSSEPESVTFEDVSRGSDLMHHGSTEIPEKSFISRNLSTALRWWRIHGKGGNGTGWKNVWNPSPFSGTVPLQKMNESELLQRLKLYERLQKRLVDLEIRKQRYCFPGSYREARDQLPDSPLKRGLTDTEYIDWNKPLRWTGPRSFELEMAYKYYVDKRRGERRVQMAHDWHLNHKYDLATQRLVMQNFREFKKAREKQLSRREAERHPIFQNVMKDPESGWHIHWGIIFVFLLIPTIPT